MGHMKDGNHVTHGKVGSAQPGYRLRHTLGFHGNGIATTGYTKHGIRWNDNIAGIWTTQDHLNAHPANGNRYLYAGGDPINNQDSTGQLSEKNSNAAAIVTCGVGSAFLGALAPPCRI